MVYYFQIGVVQFGNNYLVGASQKNTNFDARKMINEFGIIAYNLFNAWNIAKKL